jgi:hypothetical protein
MDSVVLGLAPLCCGLVCCSPLHHGFCRVRVSPIVLWVGMLLAFARKVNSALADGIGIHVVGGLKPGHACDSTDAPHVSTSLPLPL